MSKKKRNVSRKVDHAHAASQKGALDTPRKSHGDHPSAGVYRLHGKDLVVSRGSRAILEDTAKTFKGALRRLADK